MCVGLAGDAGVQRSVPIRPGSTLRLSFRHSIYGSQVEELFTVRRNGFELAQLRYSEPRLVEFYGYDSANYENGAWVVRPRSSAISSLNLRTTSAAPMS
ncbi:MAG TPA: hypothetical protein VJQ55_06060, partial [Candidatus Binatia bacterium]|nr:hypothetical protein [Candidatus Binatia bacterium]